MNFLNCTLIVTDLEATCWEEKPYDAQMETIQIASLAIPIKQGKFELKENGRIFVEGGFNQFVQPQINPKLTDFCKNLTGITQSQVDQADYFPDVFERWLTWMDAYQNYLFASWGWYDYNQLSRDTERFPYWQGVMADFPHLNIKEYVKMKLNRKKKMGVSSVLNDLGMEFEGSPHNAYDDVHNIIRILEKVG